MEVGELCQVVKGARLDAADFVVGQVEVDELLQSLESLGVDLTELTVLHVQRDEPFAFSEGPGRDAAQVVPLQVEQAGGFWHPGNLLQPHAVTDDVLKVTMAVTQAGALARAGLHRGAQDQGAGPQQQPAHTTTHAEELVWKRSERQEKLGEKAEASSEESRKDDVFVFGCAEMERNGERMCEKVSEWAKVGSTHGSIYNIHSGGKKMRRACC